MKRKEEINKASVFYREFRESCGGVKDPAMLDEIEEAHYEGAEWADHTMIERVIKWIRDNRLSFYDYDLGGTPKFHANKFYNALRKAMEV